MNLNPYIAQTRSNLRLMGRDRSVLFFSYMFPLVFFFIFAQAFEAKQSASATSQIIAMVIVIGVLGSGFFGAGMRAIQDRETNVLRRFKVAPISPAPIIVASLISGLVAFLPSLFLFLFFGNVIYHAPLPQHLLSLVIFVCIGALAFRAMGMIIAATVNSAQEGGILIQILYLPMLFLSGATFPISIMPLWVQKIAQFMPATYMFQGVQSILIGNESIAANMTAVIGLLITLVVAVFVGTKLFRWEKEEKISTRAKLWILVVLTPFVVMGAYQARTQTDIEKARMLSRTALRNRTALFQNAKIFIGDGRVINNGAVLVKNGKIAEVFEQPPTDPKSLNADVIDAAGKTLIPGLIDMHVHIGAPGGIYEDAKKYSDSTAPRRRLAAYLYSGVTAVRSTGDFLNASLQLRGDIESGKYLGAQFFACGPLFTAAGGHPTEMIENMPQSFRRQAEQEFVRLPKSAAEARSQVDTLKTAGVDCIKAVLEAGSAHYRLFNRLDTGIYDAVIAEAIRDSLPSATHTGNSADVKDAVDAGTNSVEHGSMTDLIPDSTFAEMKAKGIAYDPTLSVFQAEVDLGKRDFELLDRSLVQQVGPADLLASTRKVLQKEKRESTSEDTDAWMERLKQNLLAAYRAGVLLIAGSDAGNMLVIHGPTVQEEMELWVRAGIPANVALEAATYNAAKVLRASDRIGSIQQGRDATLVVLDGDPLQDIANTERISLVMFRGEQIDRSALFKQEP